jgi:hypothetical protein
MYLFRAVSTTATIFFLLSIQRFLKTRDIVRVKFWAAWHSLKPGERNQSTMASSAAANGDGEVSSLRNVRGKQSPLAFQRVKKQADAQTQAKARPRFPLSYKESFNQWVRACPTNAFYGSVIVTDK